MAQTQISGDGIKANAITNAHLHSSASISASKLADSGVTAGSYGSGSAIPAITVNAKGLITSVSTSSINTDLVADTSPQLGGSLDTNTKNINFGDSNGTTNRAVFGAASDLKIYHDGSHSRIDETGTGNLMIQSNNAVFIKKGTSENIAKFNVDGAVELFHDNVLKLRTQSGGTTFEGTDSGGNVSNGRFYYKTESGTVKALYDPNGGKFQLYDSVHASFGNSHDLQIYHDGNHSYIQDSGTGNLILKTNVFRLRSPNDEEMIIGNENGNVKLFYDNSKKFETSSSGVSVTGSIVVSGNVDGRDVASDGSKLDGIESGATADQSASEILTLIKTVDGSGSGLDADTLDGVQASGLVAVGGDTMTGNLRIDHGDTVDGILGEAYNTYFGLKHANQTQNSEYMILSKDFDTFISATSGYAVRIRAGGNDSTNELNIGSGNNALTWRGNKVFHAGNDGAGTGLDADTLDGIQGASLLRSDAADTASGDITFSGGAGAATIAANSDIRFNNGNWTGNAVKIQHHSNYLYISGGSNGIFFREDGTNRWLMDGSGHFRPHVDSTYDIGSNSDRVRNVYADTYYGDGSNLTGISSTNNFVNSASFNTGNGVLTLGRSGLGNITVDLDGRFATGTIPTNNNQLSNGRGFITSSGNTEGYAKTLKNSRTGSAPNYALRGWVNFDGRGSISIRGNGNVSSISDFGTGHYRVNFSTSMADGNYSTTTMGGYDNTGGTAPFIIFSNGGFDGSPLQYNSSGVRCGSTYADFRYATLMFAR